MYDDNCLNGNSNNGEKQNEHAGMHLKHSKTVLSLFFLAKRFTVIRSLVLFKYKLCENLRLFGAECQIEMRGSGGNDSTVIGSEIKVSK